jgi:hypothetical protein
VEICHVCGVCLEDRNPSRSAARVRFTSAEEAARSVPPRSAVTVPYYSLLKDIAESISELLSTCFPSSGADFIREQYFALLNHRGFITTSGHMRVVEFLNAFTDYYSPSLLSLLHCELSHTHSIVAEWAARLPYLRKTQHPLHHLLIIRFLGARISAFLSQPISPPRPFGEGPWPCLNPVCRHYRHPYISSYQVRPKSRAGKPAAVFACTCGFTYSRVGPDRLPQDVFRRDKISSYGFLWQEKLREMWLDPHNSVESIARHLGVDFSIVKQQARKLGLPARNILRKDSKLNAGRDEDPLQYRNAWLKIVEENQGERLAALLRRVTQARTVYNWLNEHDREWLLSQRQERKMPRFMKTHLLVNVRSSEEPPNKQRKDWLDKLTSEAVTEAGERIMHTPGEPQRATRAQIERAVPEVAWLLLRPNDFPLTVRAFNATRESREAFALRRIRWALQDCKEGNIKPTRHEFILRAKARRVLNIPAVQTAIEEALRILYS